MSSMSSLVERALRLWGDPVPLGEGGLAAFHAVYADPVLVNGERVPLQQLVDRARMLQNALAGMHAYVDEQFEAPGRVAFAFRITGRHVGPLTTPVGDVAATGREVQISGQDIFVVDDEAGRVTGVWAIADYMGLLTRLGVIGLTGVSPGPG